MDVSRELLALTRGDRNDPRYLKAFATAPSTAMTPIATDAQDIYIRNVLTRLRDDPDLATLRSHETELAARRDALTAAVEKRRQLAVPEASTDANRRLTLEQAKRRYNRTEAQLRLLLDDKALVESYFLPLARRAADAEDSTVE